MPQAGTTITSPPTRQTISFVRTAADSGGDELVIEARMEPGASMPPHVHLHQEERFHVLDGEGCFRIDGREIRAGAGEQLAVPARVPHRFKNESDRVVRLRATLLPALRTEDLFERLFQLGAEGRVNRLGAPGPLQTAALIREFRDEFFYLAGVPVALQRLLAGARP